MCFLSNVAPRSASPPGAFGPDQIVPRTFDSASFFQEEPDPSEWPGGYAAPDGRYPLRVATHTRDRSSSLVSSRRHRQRDPFGESR